jgi:hypothetical protein
MCDCRVQDTRYASCARAADPRWLEGDLASNAPDVEVKVADVIGLSLHSPQPVAVFCVDENTAMQALDRTDPVWPLSPRRAERHGVAYVRHGTLSLSAAFNTKTDEVRGNTRLHGTPPPSSLPSCPTL